MPSTTESLRSSSNHHRHHHKSHHSPDSGGEFKGSYSGSDDWIEVSDQPWASSLTDGTVVALLHDEQVNSRLVNPERNDHHSTPRHGLPFPCSALVGTRKARRWSLITILVLVLTIIYAIGSRLQDQSIAAGRQDPFQGVFYDGHDQSSLDTDNPELKELRRNVSSTLELSIMVEPSRAGFKGSSGHWRLNLKERTSRLYTAVSPNDRKEQPLEYPTARSTVASLPEPIVESWLVGGQISGSPSHANWPLEPSLDVIMTWVNGSDPLWQLRKFEQNLQQPHHSKGGGFETHWREFGIARHALRSVAASLVSQKDWRSSDGKPKSGLRRLHVFSADMSLDGIGFDIRGEPNHLPERLHSEHKLPHSEWSLGQVPEWLQPDALEPHMESKDQSEDGLNGPRLQWHFHSEGFHLPRSFFDRLSDTNQPEWEDEAAWKRQALPNFNSNAIEWQIGLLDGLGENR